MKLKKIDFLKIPIRVDPLTSSESRSYYYSIKRNLVNTGFKMNLLLQSTHLTQLYIFNKFTRHIQIYISSHKPHPPFSETSVRITKNAKADNATSRGNKFHLSLKIIYWD